MDDVWNRAMEFLIQWKPNKTQNPVTAWVYSPDVIDSLLQF
jgi:hypothetical protein